MERSSRFVSRFGARPVDLEPGLLDEDCGDDEEDEQIDDEVEHRREIDAVLFGCCLRVGSVPHGC